MKKYSLIILLFLCTSIQAQKKEADTTQHIVANRKNAASTYQKPYVILISADGFRYDYIEKYNAKNLEEIATKNIWAKQGMYPSYPSITFPNHYSIVTGLYPAHHGLVDNVFYDPKRDEMYVIGKESIKDGSWYGGLPLWGLAETQGMLAASLFWVGSESDAGGTRPTYWYSYHEQFSGNDKARIIKDWLSLPEEIRPHFITLYFPEVDHNGHKYGPESNQTNNAVHVIDAAIKTLVDELKPLNLPINFVFVSDHGMIGVEEKDYIPMPVIDATKFKVVNSNTFARITALNEVDILPLYERLQKEKNDYNVYLAKDFPKNLHYSSNDDTTRRIGDIIFVPNSTKLLVNSERKPSIGKHGFDSYKVPEMKATFIAWGPAFKSSTNIPSFENVNIYPLIANILGLKIERNIDGNLNVLQGILKQ